MADPNEIKKWRSYFVGLTTDNNVLDAQRHQSLMRMLSDAKQAGFVDDAFIQNYQAFRQQRLAKVRATPLVNPQTGQALTKVNPRGQTVNVTGADLFVGNQYRPDLGPAGALQARQQGLEALKTQTQADVTRLGQVREAVAPSGILGNLGMGAQALTEAVRSVPTWLQIGAAGVPGLGEVVTPPAPEDLAKAYIQKEDWSELTPEQARLEAMKPARAGGLAFGEGVAPTFGGIAGGSLGVAGVTAAGLASGPAAVVTIPTAAALGSFGGAYLSGALQEAMLRRAYGGDVYEKQVKPIFQQAYEESGSAATAGALGNVLLQGAPVLTSGVGTRRMLGLARAAWKGVPATIGGTAEQLGVGAVKAADVADMATLPGIVAQSPNKYEALVSPLLNKFSKASSDAYDAYKTFTPTPGASFGQRQRELFDFIKQTPGASDYMADAIGEQFFNVGQAAYDYTQELKNARETGREPNTLEALTNLAFGSIFIGNNKFTDVVGGAGSKIGAAALSGIERIPGVGKGITALKTRYEKQQTAITNEILRTAQRSMIESATPTERETQLGVRRRLATEAGTGQRTLGPDEIAMPIGNGRAAILNTSTGDARNVPYAEVFGGFDDTATVELGAKMGQGLGEVATERVGRGVDRLSVFGGQDAIRQVGPNQQQIVGISKDAQSDTAHVVVRETITVPNEETGRPEKIVKLDILRVEDLEEGNRAEAEKLIKSAGLEAADFKYRNLGDLSGATIDGVDISPMSMVQAMQMELAKSLPAEVTNQFPTFAQVEDGVVVRGRVIGVEKNGDIRLQLFGPSMEVIRTAPANIMYEKRGGRSTLTSAAEPISLSDLMDEVDVSELSIPVMDEKFNAFADPGARIHTLRVGEDMTRAVVLTAEQRGKLSDLIDRLNNKVRQYSTTTNDQRKIAAFRKRESDKLLSELFGKDGKPVGRREYTPGESVRVDGPNGEEFGIVFDNVDEGTLVMLPSMQGKPVLIQDESMLKGEYVDREIPTDETVQQSLKQDLQDPANAKRVLNAISQYIDNRGGADPTAKDASDLFGVPVENGKFVGEKSDALGNVLDVASALDNYKSSLPDADPARQEIDKVITYLFKVYDIFNANDFVQSFAAMSVSGKSVAEYSAMSVPNVPEFAGSISSADRAAFYVGQALRDDSAEHIARFFGLDVTSQDGVDYHNQSLSKVEEKARKIKELILAEARKPTQTDDFRADARKALDRVDAFVGVAKGFTFGRPPKKEVPKAGAKEPLFDVTQSVEEFKNENLVEGIAPDMDSLPSDVKGRFVLAQLEKVFAAIDAGEPTEDLVSAIYGFAQDGGKFIGSKRLFNARHNALLQALSKFGNKDAAYKQRIQDVAQRLKDEKAKIDDRLKSKQIKFKSAASVESGQAEAITQSEQAKESRRLTEAQARAIKGNDRVVRTDSGTLKIVEVRTVNGIARSKNLVQQLIIDVVNGKELTEPQKKLVAALEMPSPTDKPEWWQGAYQGVMWLNNADVRKAIVNVSGEFLRSNKDLTVNDLINGQPLTASDKAGLEKGGFIRADGTIDRSGVVIYGGSERGLQIGVRGVLQQSGVNAEGSDALIEAMSFSPDESDNLLRFEALRATDKASFRANITTLVAKTAAARKKSAKQVQSEIDAIVDMFDTFVHAASGRRIEMMLDALSRGEFIREAERSQQRVSVPSTRSQRRGGLEINSYAESDLKPLYDRLRELLGLRRNVSLLTYIKAPKNAEKVNAAIAILNEEEAKAFYAERMPALANFDVAPEINGILGQYLDIYDPDNQVTTSVLMAFASADISTFVHEVAHAFFEGLPSSLKREISESLGHTLRVPTITHSSVLTYEAQEKFAYGLETSLANYSGLDSWVGSNAGRGASKNLGQVLARAGDAVAKAYDVLTRNGIRLSQIKDGKHTKDWQIPYQPNGRVYLWNGAPIILGHGDFKGKYGKVRENFGTTKNGSRLVEVEIDGVIREIANQEIVAIGGPVSGLNTTTMQILSKWIGRRVKDTKQGIVESTPTGRAQQLKRNSAGQIVGVITREDDFGTGEVTNESIDLLLRAIGLNPSEVQMDVIRAYFTKDELDVRIRDASRITREYARNQMQMSQEDAFVVQLTDAYATARLVGRLNDLLARYRNTPAGERPVWYAQVKQGLDGATSRDRPQNLALFNRAKDATARVIHANRFVASAVADQLRLIAQGKGKSNWAIKLKADGSPVYNAQTGKVVLVQTFKDTRRKQGAVYEYEVDLNTGASRPLTPGAKVTSAIPDMVIPDTLVSEFPWRPKAKPGGTIQQINADAKEALRNIGILSDQYRVFSPEYFIAEALMKEGINKKLFGPRERSASFLAQAGNPIDTSTSGVYGTQDVVPMAQLGVEATRQVVTPQIAYPELVSKPDRMGIIQAALREGQVDQAMQVTGATVTTMNDEARRLHQEWMDKTLLHIETTSSDELRKAKEKWESQNPGQTAQLYRYEAYVVMDIFDNEKRQPWIKEDAMPDKKGNMPVRQERVKTVIFSYQDLARTGKPKEVQYWETELWGASTANDSRSTTISAVEFGRNVFVDTKTKKKVDPEKGSIAKAFAEGAQKRVREVINRWPSQYNPATDGGEPVDPTMAWMPSYFKMEATTKTQETPEGKSVSIVVPSVKPIAAPYALDRVEGNEGWGSVKVTVLGKNKDQKSPQAIASALKSADKTMQEAYQTEKVGSRKHQAVVYPIAFSDKGEPTRWAYRMMVRDDTLNFNFFTDDNNGKGYDTQESAVAEANRENTRLGGLSRVKQEEAVSRRIADETVDILEVARKGIRKANPKDRTKAEQNAINIVAQFTWYKSMEKRLVGTYGQFATVMADALGATSPQTPVWQNYLATMYLMAMGVNKHNRRVAISKQTAERNANLVSMLTGTKKGEEFLDLSGAVAVIDSDVRRTLIVKRLHDGLIAKFPTIGDQPVKLTVENYKTVMSDIPGWSGESWASIFESDVPANKRESVLNQFNEYLSSAPSRLGADSKKDIQFRSFVNEVDDWVQHKGNIVRAVKGRQAQILGKITKDMQFSLAETIVPRNVTSGKLFGSNSQNVVLALANEWLTVSPGMSSKARNFAMNFIGLSKGATIDVWAARLTRRHLNEHFMGVRSVQVPKMDGDKQAVNEQGEPITEPQTLIIDEEKYRNWEKLREEDRKQYFRLMPMQEGAVKGGYVSNLPDAVSSEGYFTPEGRTEPVELVGPDREYTDVRDARINEEFGAANRIFASATDKVNAAIGKPGFMSAADLQAVVWFAEKARWTQNGWTTAAGAGGSFEQMYNVMAYLGGGYRRGSVSVAFRNGSEMAFTDEELASIHDFLAVPFQRERNKYYTPEHGDVQRVIVTEDQTELLPAPPITAMTMNVLSRREFDESVEEKASAQVSLSAMLSRGRDEKADVYTGTVPHVVVPKDYARRMALQLSGKSYVYLPVTDADLARDSIYGIGIGRRVVFSTIESGQVRPVGSAVVDFASPIDVSDVPQDDRVSGENIKYLRLELREEQSTVDSAIHMHGNMGRDKSGVWGTPMTSVPKAQMPMLEQMFGSIETDVARNGVHIGQLNVDMIKNANKKGSVLPRPPRVAASNPGNMGAFVESAMNVLVGMRDAKDCFVTHVDTIENEDDPLYEQGQEISTVPSENAWRKNQELSPENNKRYGILMVMEAPVGEQRRIASEEKRIISKVTRAITMLQQGLPDVGFNFRIDADARDLFSDITGNKGFSFVEIIFSPEQYIREFNPVAEIDGQRPDTEKAREARFTSYVSGDVNAIRKGEQELVSAVRNLVEQINNDPDLKGAIVLSRETIYTGHAIPKELVRSSNGNLEALAKSEFARRSDPEYGIAQAAREYAEAIGKTAYAETTDSFYDGEGTPRVASPSDVIHDWNSVSDYTVMAQFGLSPRRESVVPRTNTQGARRVNVVASAYAGTSRLGYNTLYQSAMEDYYAGRLNDFKRKMDRIALAAKEEFDNAMDGLDVDWAASLNPSVISGDAKPSILGTARVNEVDLNRLIGRAAILGRRLAQSNVFVTASGGNATFGLKSDGSMVVPSIKLKLTSPLDPVDLRRLVDTNPGVFNGANQSVDKLELELFMVPDVDFGRSEAREWTSEAIDFVNRFFMENNGLVEPAKPVEGIGINIKSDGENRYADLIIDGTKKYESRATDSLRPYVGKQVGIIRTGEGQAKLVGVATIGEPIVVNESEFDSMRSEHLVPKGSAFDIAKGGTKYLYPITSPVRFDEETIVSSQGIIARKVMIPEGLLSSGNVESPEIENGKAKAVVSNARVSDAKESRLRLWNIGSAEHGGKGRFIEYDDVLAIVSAVAPDNSIPTQEKVTFRTNERLRKELEFALSVIHGEPVELPKRVKINRTTMHSQLQKSIANHFDLMPLNSLHTDPFVKPAYEALVKELSDQYKVMNLTVRFMPVRVDANGKAVLDEDGFPQFDDPYQSRSERVMRDIEENRNIYVYPTTPSTFGDSSVSWTGHPLLEESPFRTADGDKMLWNDVLRAVHDAIAHGVYGSTFGKDGEELAFAAHALVTRDPWAIWALAMETRMQNSWVHFNKNNLDELGEPKPWNESEGSRFSDQKVGLPALDAIYTGINQVDDRIRAFSYLLRTKHGDYNGTVQYLRANNPDALAPEARIGEGKIALDGIANGITAFGTKAVVVHNPKLKGEAIVDLKNGVIEANVTQSDIAMIGDDVSSIFDASSLEPKSLQAQFLKEPKDFTPMAQIGGPTEALAEQEAEQQLEQQPAQATISPLQRAVLVVTRLLKTGASGDASPILMQNFLSANLLENPAMLLRQIKLQAQILANPNMGFQRKDGTIVNAGQMRGRKFFDDTLESEVRGRTNYDAARNAGLTMAAATREKALDELRQTNPNATYADIDELGYDTDAASDADWLKHLPGQGQSERFFALSKDLCKMAAFDNMVDTLISLGYTPTAWNYDEDGKLIETNWTRALKDLAALLNVASGDVRFADADDIDKKMATLAKMFFFAPRWMTSRLLLDQWGRHMFEWAASRAGDPGKEWANKILTINRMNRSQILNRDKNVSKMHQRLMTKAYLQWLAMILGIYMMRLTNPETMKVSIEDGMTKFKIGDYSFRAPGAILTSAEMTMALVDGFANFKPFSYETTTAEQWQTVWSPLSKAFMSRASPLLSLGSEVLTGKTPFGEPAFIPDEAAKRYWNEVVRPGIEASGIKVPANIEINTAISKRMLWWWMKDAIDSYDTDRRLGLNKESALLKSAMIGAYSAEGGRVSYRPKALRWEIERNKNLQATPDMSEFLTGVAATPVDTADYTADKIGEDPGPVRQPLIGSVGDYRVRDSRYEDYTTLE